MKLIRLEEIDDTNWRYPLKVSRAQKNQVSNAAAILARAYAYRNFRSRAFLICEEETPVGMVLYYDCPALNSYDISQIFIDERYQGHGYGKNAMQLVLKNLKREGNYQKVVLCYVEGNDTAAKLYEKLGFRETGRDGDEIIMEMTFTQEK